MHSLRRLVNSLLLRKQVRRLVHSLLLRKQSRHRFLMGRTKNSEQIGVSWIEVTFHNSDCSSVSLRTQSL